jgi:hypothetical protein
LFLTGFIAIVIIHNNGECNRSLTGGPEESREDKVNTLERGISETRQEAVDEKKKEQAKPNCFEHSA